MILQHVIVYVHVYLTEFLGSYDFDGSNRIGRNSAKILFLTGPAGTVDAPEGWLAGFNVYAANSHPFNLGIWRLTGETNNKNIYTYVWLQIIQVKDFTQFTLYKVT